MRTKVFARVGELIQGKLTVDEHFIIPGLITSDFYTETFIDEKPIGEELKPIVKRALIYFYRYTKEGESIVDLRKTIVKESEFDKYFDPLLNFTQVSNIPFGKGFTSMSADCLSALKAINEYEKAFLDNEVLYQLASLCTLVDPCLENEIAQIFDPINGSRIFHLPEVNIAGLFFDTDIDKINHPAHLYNSLEYSELEMEQFTYLMDFYQQGLLIDDLSPIFEATWKSAQINERFNKTKNLGLLKEYCDSQEVGVFVSHVGTYAGVYGRPAVIENIKVDFETFVKEKWNGKVFFASNNHNSVGI